jgi:hypothetical protein
MNIPRHIPTRIPARIQRAIAGADQPRAARPHHQLESHLDDRHSNDRPETRQHDRQHDRGLSRRRWAFDNTHTHDRLVRELAAGVYAAVAFPEYELPPTSRFADGCQGFRCAVTCEAIGRRPAGRSR